MSTVMFSMQLKINIISHRYIYKKCYSTVCVSRCVRVCVTVCVCVHVRVFLQKVRNHNYFCLDQKKDKDNEKIARKHL